MKIKLFLCLLVFLKNNYHNKAKKVCIKTRSPSASLPSITVKWPVACNNARRQTKKNEMKLKDKMDKKHQIDCDSGTCITYCTDYYQRLTLESWAKLFKAGLTQG